MRTSSGTLFTSSHSKDSSSVPTMYTMLQCAQEISIFRSSAAMQIKAAQSRPEGDASDAVPEKAELMAHDTQDCVPSIAPGCRAHQCSPVRPLKSVMMPFHHLLSCALHAELSAIGKPRMAVSHHGIRAARPLPYWSLVQTKQEGCRCEEDSRTHEGSHLPRSGPLCAQPGGSGP